MNTTEQRREEMLKQIRVEDDARWAYVKVYPFPDRDISVKVNKPTSRMPAWVFIPGSTTDSVDDVERLGLALQQAAELARVLDARFKEEHGL
jgi:hypothetical protein